MVFLEVENVLRMLLFCVENLKLLFLLKGEWPYLGSLKVE